MIAPTRTGAGQCFSVEALPFRHRRRTVEHGPGGIVSEKCGTCNGQGGWWDHGNGQAGKPPKRWIKCHDCQGAGSK